MEENSVQGKIKHGFVEVVLKCNPLLQAVQGIWARELEDATCAAINHKYRLLAYGRAK